MTESLDQEIRTLRAHYWSARDPEGRGFAPLAEAYRLQGEIEEAASLIQDGLERLPGFVAGYLIGSRIARDRGDLLGGRALLDRALELDPENVVARFERAALVLEEGDREGALGDLRTVLDLDPTHQDAIRLLAEIESGSRLEERDEPAADIPLPASELSPAAEVSEPSEGAEEGPDRSLLTRTMGDLYAAQGFLDRALDVYRELSAADPDDEELQSRIAELSVRVETDRAGGGSPSGEKLSGGTRLVAPDAFDDEDSSAGVTLPGTGDRWIRSYFIDLLAWVPGAVPIGTLAPDELAETEGPIPVEALAPGSTALGFAEDDLVVDNPFPELGIPVPVALLAPDSEGGTPTRLEELR